MIIIMHRIFSIVFIICVVLNIVLGFHISNGIKSNFHSYWKEIGGPSNLDPRGQLVYMKLFFNKKTLPREILQRYSTPISLLVAARVIGLLCFLLIIILAIAFPEMFSRPH